MKRVVCLLLVLTMLMALYNYHLAAQVYTGTE